jgi:predicted phage baseplate assembly protein
VPNFQAQPPDAKVFVTRRDKDQNTTVIFGDGVNGARLTTGAGNATATYRYGSGPGDPRLGRPAAGTVVTVLTPYPGLGSIRNPVPMTGGAAPGTPQQVQANAPDTVLSFGRTISSVDYAAAAARVPSVTRARAQTGWDAQTSRNAVFVYVSGGPDAVAATQAALRKIADPNRPVVVRRATEIDLLIALVVSYDPSVDPSTVQSGIVAALTDPVAGVFAPSAIGIGDALFDSSIYAACHQVAGVVAVRGLTIRTITGMAAADYANAPILAGAVHPSGAGGYFALAANAVIINLEAAHG